MKAPTFTAWIFPDDATIDIAQGWLFVTPPQRLGRRRTYLPAGCAAGRSLQDFMHGKRSFDVLFDPSPRRSLASFTVTRSHVLVEELDNVRDRIYDSRTHGGQWRRRELDMPKFGDISIKRRRSK